MSGKVRGIVHNLSKTEVFGAKGFKKRTLVLKQDNGAFTNYIPLDFTRDACEEADELREGDEIEVKYQLGGRKWQKDDSEPVRYFLSAEVVGFMVINRSQKQARRESSDSYEEREDGTPF